MASLEASESAKPKSRPAPNAPKGSPVAEDHGRQGDEAAPGGHHLIETPHRAQREVAAGKTGHHPAQQHGDVAGADRH